MKEEERQREEEKREISLDVFFFVFFLFQCCSCLPAYQQVSQAVSLSTMKPVTPASKQANRSISFSGATGMGPSNATKQRATVLHHFPSERLSRPQPLITRHCQSAAHQGLHCTGLFTAFCSHSSTIIPAPGSRLRLLFQLSGVSPKEGLAHKRAHTN